METDVWRVVSKSVSALVLMFGDKPVSDIISTITIDAENGTFIHTFSGRAWDSNQVTVWWGTCSN